MQVECLSGLVCNKTYELWVVRKMLPRVAPWGKGRKPPTMEYFRPLHRQVGVLQEELRWGVDMRKRDESEDEAESKEPFKEEAQLK